MNFLPMVCWCLAGTGNLQMSPSSCQYCLPRQIHWGDFLTLCCRPWVLEHALALWLRIKFLCLEDIFSVNKPVKNHLYLNCLKILSRSWVWDLLGDSAKNVSWRTSQRGQRCVTPAEVLWTWVQILRYWFLVPGLGYLCFGVFALSVDVSLS